MSLLSLLLWPLAAHAQQSDEQPSWLTGVEDEIYATGLFEPALVSEEELLALPDEEEAGGEPELFDVPPAPLEPPAALEPPPEPLSFEVDALRMDRKAEIERVRPEEVDLRARSREERLADRGLLEESLESLEPSMAPADLARVAAGQRETGAASPAELAALLQQTEELTISAPQTTLSELAASDLRFSHEPIVERDPLSASLRVTRLSADDLRGAVPTDAGMRVPGFGGRLVTARVADGNVDKDGLAETGWLSILPVIAQSEGVGRPVVAFGISTVDPHEGPLARDEQLGLVRSASLGTIEDARNIQVVAVGRDGEFSCSGVLLRMDVVLTARHCLPANEVRFGADVGKPLVAARVARAIVPPTAGVDAALLYLDRDVLVQETRLPGASDEPPPGARLVAIGYGRTVDDDRRGFGVKHRVELSSSEWGCGPGAEWTSGCDPAWEITVRSLEGTDTCDGDSGGPLYAVEGERVTLLGITSRPVRDARHRCGDGGVYVRITRLRPWLDEEITKLLELKNTGGVR